MRRSYFIVLLSAFIVIPVVNNSFASGDILLISPDKSIRVKISDEAALHYSISLNGKSVIESSPFSFSIDGVELTDDTKIERTNRYAVNESFPSYGIHSTSFNRCNGIKISLQHSSSRMNYTLEVRAYNDGVAFRFISADRKKIRLPDEASRFILPVNSTVWYHDLNGHYEGIHKKSDLSEIRDTHWIAPPMTFKLPGNTGYASITEASLVNYAGMALKADGSNGFVVRLGSSHPVSYPYRLRYSAEDIKRLSIPAPIAGKITTPWRVVIIGADLNALVNCDMINALSPPPDKKIFPLGIKTEWIKPGRAVWKYLDGGENTLDEMKRFSKMAGELGFEYNIIEGFWKKWTDEEIKDLVNFSDQFHVGVWFWLHSKNLRDSSESRPLFERLRKLGVRGVKIDFFDHEAKETIDLYQRLLKETAENKLLVDFHGANKPAGESRTWPNELTREAIKGMEASKLQDRATHETTLPFTRMLAGQAEYTVVHFGERRKNTTWAHQVASAAILSAPCLTYAANPANILSNPAAEIIKSIPSVWDETIVLPPSEIGECAIYARRKGSDWFLAVMNGVAARKVRIPLSFLGEHSYKTFILSDTGDNAASVNTEEKVLTGAGFIDLDLMSGGGYIARFSKN